MAMTLLLWCMDAVQFLISAWDCHSTWHKEGSKKRSCFFVIKWKQPNCGHSLKQTNLLELPRNSHSQTTVKGQDAAESCRYFGTYTDNTLSFDVNTEQMLYFLHRWNVLNVDRHLMVFYRSAVVLVLIFWEFKSTGKYWGKLQIV